MDKPLIHFLNWATEHACGQDLGSAHDIVTLESDMSDSPEDKEDQGLLNPISDRLQ